MNKICLSAWLSLCCTALCALDPVSMVSDPPPAIDGSLDRLNRLLTRHVLTPETSLTYGEASCQGKDDFSGTVILGYDHGYLYLGATVTDDKFMQNHTQGNLWKGDHIMAVFQYPYVPQCEDSSTENLYVFGFSPGNFEENAPEAWVFTPSNTPVAGIRVAARKEENGYRLEAAIPWSIFKAGAPAVHDRLRYDVLLGDSDTGDQDTMLSISSLPTTPRPWSIKRLREGVFAKADGTFEETSVKQSELWHGKPGAIEKGKSVTVELPKETAAKTKSLTVRMALEFPNFGGGTRGASIRFNDTLLDGKRCLNRDKNIKFSTHDMGSCFANGDWFVVYGAMDGKDYANFYSSGIKIDPLEFVFDVSDLVKPDGKNTVTITHAGQAGPKLNYEISTSEFLMKANRLVLKEAPTGELPVFTADHQPRANFYQAKLMKTGEVAVTVNGRTYEISSDFSTLKPDWARFAKDPGDGKAVPENNTVTLHSKNFTVARTLDFTESSITVKDTLTNLTDRELPVMYQHSVPVAAESKVFVCGYPKLSDRASNAEPSRPTVLALEKTSGIGLVGEDDLTRIQGSEISNGNSISLSNDRLLLAPHKTVELEFSIYPLERPEQYVFINRIRDAWNVNFTIDGGFRFLSIAEKFPVETIRKQLELSGTKYVSASLSYNYSHPEGPANHGNRYTQVDLSSIGNWVKLMREVNPDIKLLTYFHCFISNGIGDRERYKNEALITPAGEISEYAPGLYPIFVPVPGSEFAKMQDKVIDLRFAQGVDAIYWDELEYSKSRYSYSDKYWDGCTALIDTRTHQVKQKITSVPILTEEWRLDLIDRLMKRGKGVLIANGAPFTKRMREYHFPRFIETGSLANLVQAQLYSPISLGDHLTVKTELDEYQDMLKALEYGCVYYNYPRIMPTKPQFVCYMYPMTPVALGHGYIIGEERILTKISGLFGWNDDSSFKAVVFDREGSIVPDFKVPKVTRNGKNYAEVRIPEGYGVSLIRDKK